MTLVIQIQKLTPKPLHPASGPSQEGLSKMQMRCHPTPEKSWRQGAEASGGSPHLPYLRAAASPAGALMGSVPWRLGWVRTGVCARAPARARPPRGLPLTAPPSHQRSPNLSAPSPAPAVCWAAPLPPSLPPPLPQAPVRGGGLGAAQLSEAGSTGSGGLPDPHLMASFP